MSDILFRVLLGHLVGDYLLQTEWMALNKKKNYGPCIIHCTIWTLSVCTFLLPELINLGFTHAAFVYLLIFISHFALDKTNVIDNWLHFIGSRSFRRTNETNLRNLLWTDHTLPEKTLYAYAYTTLVQTVADNTIHLLFLWVIVRLFVCGE